MDFHFRSFSAEFFLFSRCGAKIITGLKIFIEKILIFSSPLALPRASYGMHVLIAYILTKQWNGLKRMNEWMNGGRSVGEVGWMEKLAGNQSMAYKEEDLMMIMMGDWRGFEQRMHTNYYVWKSNAIHSYIPLHAHNCQWIVCLDCLYLTICVSALKLHWSDCWAPCPTTMRLRRAPPRDQVAYTRQ